MEAKSIEEVRKTILEDVFIESGVVSGKHREICMAFNECSGTRRSSLSRLFSSTKSRPSERGKLRDDPGDG